METLGLFEAVSSLRDASGGWIAGGSGRKIGKACEGSTGVNFLDSMGATLVVLGLEVALGGTSLNAGTSVVSLAEKGAGSAVVDVGVVLVLS